MKKYCLLLCLCAGVAQGSVINVTCGEGTIQSAVDKARPGDEVVIGPGVYFESVKIDCRGTAEHPIVIRADRVAPNRVIVSGADRAVREGRVKWTLEDESLRRRRAAQTLAAIDAARAAALQKQKGKK